MELIKKVNSFFNRKQKNKLYFLLLIIFSVSLLDLIGIGAILPLLIIFSDPSFLENSYIILILDYFSFLNKNNFLEFVVIFILIIYALKTISSLALNYIKFKILFSFYNQISNKLMNIYINLSYSEFIKFKIFEKSNTLKTEVEYFILGVIDPILIICLELLTITLICAFLLYYDADLLIKIFIFGTLITILLSYTFSKKLKIIGSKKFNLNNLLQQQIFQGLQGVKDIKLSVKEEIFLKKFSDITVSMSKVSSSIKSIQEAPRLLIEFFAVLCFILIIFINIGEETQFSEIIVKLGIFAAASFRILPSLNRIVISINSIKQSHKVIETMYNDFKLENKIPKKNNLILNTPKIKKIEIKNLSFTYPGSNFSTLTNINLEINKGDYIGLFGKSGSGKSTFVDIFSGLLVPQSGEILFDNKNINNYENIWKSKIGYVPQKIYLNNETIKENIAFGQHRDDIDDEKVYQAINKARLNELIENKIENIENLIGENGINLSGGQIQRLGIARAIYRDPEILIFDESTNSLDNETEQEFMKTVNKLKGEKIILFISHKTELLNDCNKIYELSNEKLIPR